MCRLIRTLTARFRPATQTLRLLSLGFVARLLAGNTLLLVKPCLATSDVPTCTQCVDAHLLQINFGTTKLRIKMITFAFLSYFSFYNNQIQCILIISGRSSKRHARKQTGPWNRGIRQLSFSCRDWEKQKVCGYKKRQCSKWMWPPPGAKEEKTIKKTGGHLQLGWSLCRVEWQQLREHLEQLVPAKWAFSIFFSDAFRTHKHTDLQRNTQTHKQKHIYAT